MAAQAILGGIFAGATGLGNYLSSRTANEAAKRQDALQRAELQRRNAVQGIVAPSLLRGLGYRNPTQIAQMQRQIAQPDPGFGGNLSDVPSPSHSASNVALGAVAGGPIGAYAANKIGQGRRTANQATGDAGFEGQFRNTLTDMSAHGGDLAALEEAYQRYIDQIDAWKAKGGNNAKVASQSLANKPLQQTYQTLRGQLGGR